MQTDACTFSGSPAVTKALGKVNEHTRNKQRAEDAIAGWDSDIKAFAAKVTAAQNQLKAVREGFLEKRKPVFTEVLRKLLELEREYLSGKRNNRRRMRCKSFLKEKGTKMFTSYLHDVRWDAGHVHAIWHSDTNLNAIQAFFAADFKAT